MVLAWMDSTLGRRLWDNLIVFLLYIMWNWCPLGKFLSINRRKPLPMFVVTFELYEGLNYMNVLDLFLLARGKVSLVSVNCSGWS